MTSFIRRRLPRSAAIALTIGAVAAVTWIATAAGAQSRSQGGTMILRTSVTAIAPNGNVVVTAIVRFGSLAASGGTVTFTDKTNHRRLGTAVLSQKSGAPCAPPARVCRARLTVSGHKLARGANRIIGLFTPSRLYYPTFQAKTWMYRGVRPNCHAVSPSTLPVFTASPIRYAATRHNVICKGRVKDPHGGTAVTVTSYERATVTRNTVVAFGAQTLPCSTRNTGDLLAYSISTRAPGNLAFEVLGHQAVVAHKAHPNGYLCYESSIPFRTASGARAKRTSVGYYYGTLPHCRDNDGDDMYPVHENGDDQRLHPAPCIEWQQYSVKHGQATWTTWFEATTGDPRVSW